MLIQASAMPYSSYPSSLGGIRGGVGGGGDFNFNNSNNNNSHNHNNYNNGGSGSTGRPHQAVDIMTYSSYVNGSIFSIPKCWSEENTDQVLLTVYSFIKTFVG
jgi:hypothetical protein